MDLPADTTVPDHRTETAVPYFVPAQGADTDAWPTPEMTAARRTRFRHAAPPDRPVPAPDRAMIRRRPALGLVAIVVLSLLAAFFAWVTAEPLWLALGHGDSGVATVTSCVGTGVGRRCIGDFTANDGTLVERVTLLGVGNSGAGAAIGARMVARTSDQAYVGAALEGLHLRWLVSLGLTLLCGLGIAAATGALRIPDRRARRFAIATSLGAHSY